MKLITTMALTLAALVVAAPAGAGARDRDHDGLPDRWEKRFHLSTTKKSANRDPDRDRVDNRNEFRRAHEPAGPRLGQRRPARRREDRDHDGLRNLGEDLTGNDPIDPDTDDDGIEDGDEQVGTVVSFVDGVLVIETVNGDRVSGRVTESTEIECESENEAEHEQEGPDARASEEGSGESGEEPGEEEGEHGEEPGEEEGEHGEEPGEEEGEHGERERGSGRERGRAAETRVRARTRDLARTRARMRMHAPRAPWRPAPASTRPSSSSRPPARSGRRSS